MNAFLRFFRVYLSVYLRTKSFLFLLILLPISVISVAFLTDKFVDEATITAAVYIENQNDGKAEITDKIVSELKNNNDINFVFLQNEEELYRKIKSQEAAVGYVFAEDFTNCIANLDYEEIVRRVNLEDNPYAIFVDRVVLSTVFDALVPHISKKQLAEIGLFYDIDILQSQVDFYDKDGFSVEILYANGNEVATVEDDSNAFAANLINGIVSLYLLVISLSAAAFCADEDDSSSLFSPFLGRTKLQFYKITPVIFLGYFTAVISLLVSALLFKNEDANIIFDLINLSVYQISLLIASVLISKYVKKEIIVSLIPFVVVFAVVTHPIIFDITTFFPVTKKILVLLPSYNFLLNDVNSVLRMLIILAVLFPAANGFFLKRKN